MRSPNRREKKENLKFFAKKGELPKKGDYKTETLWEKGSHPFLFIWYSLFDIAIYWNLTYSLVNYDLADFCYFHLLIMKTKVLVTFKKNFMAPFYGWGSTASRLVPLRGDSLLFTTKFPDIPGAHFIDLGRMKGWVDLGATQWFWTGDPWIRNPAP